MIERKVHQESTVLLGLIIATDVDGVVHYAPIMNCLSNLRFRA